MQIRFTTAEDAWVGGSTLTASFASALFLHSTDGGNTWAEPAGQASFPG